MKNKGVVTGSGARKFVYLFELDSVRKTDEEICIAYRTLLDEIVLNGNVVVMTYNQLVDSRLFFSILKGGEYESKIVELFQMGAIRISRFGDIRTVSQYLLDSIDDDKQFIYSAIPVKYSQKRLIALMKRCMLYSDMSELDEFIKKPASDMDEVSKNKLADLFVEVINGHVISLNEKAGDFVLHLTECQKVLESLKGLLSTVLRISVLTNIYVNPRQIKEYSDLRFYNILGVVQKFSELGDDKLINVDTKAFRAALDLLGKLECWKEKRNDRSVYIRQIKDRWMQRENELLSVDKRVFQYAEVIVNLCYNYACENSICNISKHYNVEELRNIAAGDWPSFRVDFFGRFAQDWRGGTDASVRYLADETNVFESYEDRNGMLINQLTRTVRLARYINYNSDDQTEKDKRVIHRYEFNKEKQTSGNKKRIVVKILRGMILPFLCIIVACSIELIFNGLQSLIERFVSFNTEIWGIFETILWLFITEALSTFIASRFPKLISLSDAVGRMNESVVDMICIIKRKLSAYFSHENKDVNLIEDYSAGVVIPYICPAEIKKYRLLKRRDKTGAFSESDIYPIADTEDVEVTEQMIRQEELFHWKYGVTYKSRFNMLIVDPIKGEKDIFPYERVLPPEKDGVVVVARYKEKFVLLRQYRHAIRRIQYSFPRGFAESEDASPANSAIRELTEELNAIITAEPVFLGRIVPDSGLTGGRAYVYSVDIDYMELQDSHEGIVGLELLDNNDMNNWIREGRIDDGFTLGAYGLLKGGNGRICL